MAEYPRNGLIPLPYHHVMLTDEARMQAFERAIQVTVSPGDVVLEVGGGTGILSMLAARQAKKVYTVEYSPENAAACTRFVALNGLSDRIEVVCADAREWLPPEPVQVVICEMLHVALVNEQQVQVMNHLHRQVGAFKAIPMGVVNLIEPVEVDFRVRGFELPFMRYQAYGVQDPAVRALVREPRAYWQADFYGVVDEQIDQTVTMVAEASGTCNAIRLTTIAVVDALADDDGQFNRWALQQLIVPLERPVALKPGDSLELRVLYSTGCDLGELSVAAASYVNK